MPVEDGNTAVAGTPNNWPTSRQTRWQALIPASPVAQFALPEFTSSARTRPRLAAKEARPTTRGAATTRFFVNIAAAAVPAQAIMTTDTVPKQVSLHHEGNWTVGGMAKGAGMLAPSLATMLCVITTDAVADADALDRALRNATARTFDRLDVDGSCSTNDTVLLLASGASEVAPSQDELDAALLAVCDDLCAQLQADAEGVTKRIAITVTGAASEDDAVVAARVIARDSLVKTALFGSDANWGRVLAAVGMAPVTLDSNRISVSFNGSPVCIDGVGAPGARDVDLSGAYIEVTIDLGVGDGRASIRTTDLSHGYVEENSAYSS